MYFETRFHYYETRFLYLVIILHNYVFMIVLILVQIQDYYNQNHYFILSIVYEN